MIKLNVCKRLIGSEGPFELSVRFNIPEGRLTVLYGASGAGKSTLLRMLAGLNHPDDGYIKVDGETWFSFREKVCVPPQRRGVGLVFQNYALFPSMTVRRNLEFAAGRRKDPRVEMFLEMVELQELQDRYPEELSGGQQQRVALARALVRRPKILLLDEPLSALDEGMRVKLQEEIIGLHKELGLTTILVSHDRAEILRMADQVLAIGDGRLTFDGLPFQMFQKNQAVCNSYLQGEILDMFVEEESVFLVVRTGNGNAPVEVRLTDQQLHQLFENGLVQRPNSRVKAIRHYAVARKEK